MEFDYKMISYLNTANQYFIVDQNEMVIPLIVKRHL